MNAGKPLSDFEKRLNNNVQVYFTSDCDMYDINVEAESVDKIVVNDGILEIHDLYDNVWHCYNMKYIKHFHVPGGIKLL